MGDGDPIISLDSIKFSSSLSFNGSAFNYFLLNNFSYYFRILDAKFLLEKVPVRMNARGTKSCIEDD